MAQKILMENDIPIDHIGKLLEMVSNSKFLQGEIKQVEKIEKLPGGLTNDNYKVDVDNITYAVRLAGAGTSEYLNRPAEKYNAGIMSEMNINAPIFYYDELMGNQICKYIDKSKTLHPVDFKLDKYIKAAADTFKRYHTSGKKFQFSFNPIREIVSYKKILQEKQQNFYDNAEDMEKYIEKIDQLLKKIPLQMAPCHNDPLCENWLDNGKQVYLIDWEYSGMNDPLFDLGALSIEAVLDSEQEKYLLANYYDGNLKEKDWGEFILNKFLCDALWSYWAVLQIAMGKSYDDYWTYGEKRYMRAYKLINDGTLETAIKYYAD